MRITCPLCGERDLREFTPRGHETLLRRPEAGAPVEEWDEYLHLRDNPCGPTREVWHHSHGCRAWLVVERDTATHDVLSVTLAREAAAA